MQQQSEFAARLRSAMANPVKPAAELREAALREAHTKGIRTKVEEGVIQDMTPEQQEWYSICDVHRAQEGYAREMARNVLAKIETKRMKMGLIEALNIVVDRKYLTDLMRVLQVGEDHVELAVDLVQGVAKIRYARHIG